MCNHEVMASGELSLLPSVGWQMISCLPTSG